MLYESLDAMTIGQRLQFEYLLHLHFVIQVWLYSSVLIVGGFYHIIVEDVSPFHGTGDKKRRYIIYRHSVW
jgi:hypothetical protein